MSMGSRKVNTEGIDEELLIASIGRRKQDGTLYRAQEPPTPAHAEESVPETEQSPVPSREKPPKDSGRRKRQEDDYSGMGTETKRGDGEKVLELGCGMGNINVEIRQP